MKEEKYGTEREVSFLDKDVDEWMRREAHEDGLCLKKFRADHVVEGLKSCRPGDVLEAGGQTFLLTAVGKRCFPECGLLKHLGRKCPLADGMAFGKKV